MALIKNNQSWVTPEKFGPLWKYVVDDEVTNIDYDAGALWVERAGRIRELVNEAEINDAFMEDFAIRVGNETGKNFNIAQKWVMSDTDTLRIVCLHPEFSLSGITVCIRKSLPKLRFTTQMAIDQGYCDEKIMNLLINCVLAGKNFVFCGEPGQGKTEASKFFSSFIPAHKKVITIEDVREWHYKEINPGKSCIEMVVNNDDEYEKALSLSLRLNPSYLMVAETRGREVCYLLEAYTNGIPNMTSLHTNHVANIPDRIMNMLGMEHVQQTILDQIYNNVGVGVQLKKIEMNDGTTKHKITEVGFFYRKDGKNGVALIVEDGKFYPERMPHFVLEQLQERLGHDPYVCDVAHNNTAPIVQKGSTFNIEETEIKMPEEQ